MLHAVREYCEAASNADPSNIDLLTTVGFCSQALSQIVTSRQLGGVYFQLQDWKNYLETMLMIYALSPTEPNSCLNVASAYTLYANDQ